MAYSTVKTSFTMSEGFFLETNTKGLTYLQTQSNIKYQPKHQTTTDPANIECALLHTTSLPSLSLKICKILFFDFSKFPRSRSARATHKDSRHSSWRSTE